jgi:LemA protein
MESGTISELVLLVFAAAVLLYALILYKALLRLCDANDRAWGQLETSLQNLYDEIPNLPEIAPLDATASRAISQAHADCLTASSIAQKSAAHAKLENALRTLFAQPRFAGSHNFAGTFEHIIELQQHIADAGRSFNRHALVYNVRIGQIPDVFVASVMGLQRRDLFLLE